MKKLFIILSLLVISIAMTAQPRRHHGGGNGNGWGNGHHHHGGGGGGGGCGHNGHCPHVPIDSIYWILLMTGLGAGYTGYSLYKEYEDKKKD